MLLYSQCIFCISPWFWLSYHCGSTLDLFSIIRRQTHCCCILFTAVTLHLFTLSPDNINLMQSEHQQHKICGDKKNLLWHTYTLWAIKTALVTLSNAKTVLLKGQGSRYNNEPSGPSSSSPPETQTLHHLQPVVYKRGENGCWGWVGRSFRSSTSFSNANVWKDSCSRCIIELKLRESEKQQDLWVWNIKRQTIMGQL